MVQVCEATGYVQVVLPDGTKLPVVNDARTPAPIPACMKWVEAGAEPQVSAGDLAEAFGWGVLVVTLFALSALPLRHVITVIRNAFRPPDL